MPYFSDHGSVWITLEDGNQIQINDLTVFANISKAWRENSNLQMTHKIKDGETPSILSDRLYDTVQYWWTILLMNDISDVTEQWPRTYDDLNKYIEEKYPNQSKYDVHHYIDPNGFIADIISYRIKYNTTSNAEAIEAGGLEPITIEEYETALNENKRNIVLIDPDYISIVEKEYSTAMSGG